MATARAFRTSSFLRVASISMDENGRHCHCPPSRFSFRSPCATSCLNPLLSAMSSEEVDQSEDHVSALRHNISQKGRNAYYFAHTNTPTGPEWDGRPEPKLLSTENKGVLERTQSSFNFSKSNITSYAFSDGEKSVKLYIDLQEGWEDDKVTLDYTEDSLSLQIATEDPKSLVFSKLAGKITKASYKLKELHLVLILRKETPGETWHTINDKGTPDNEVV